MRLSFLLFALFGAATSDASVVPATLVGRVVDPSGAPVEGAVVQLEVGRLSRTTDATGRFEFGERPAAVETLLVRHPDFVDATIPLDLGVREAWDLDVVLERRATQAPNTDEQARARASAASLSVETGGMLLPVEAFERYLRYASHPLEILLYTGFAEGLTLGGARGDCVALRDPWPCATLVVRHETTRSDDLGTWTPAEIDSFVITQPMGDDDGGSVTVFMWAAR